MSYSLRFLPEVADDVVAGARWIYARCEEICREPLACATFAGRYRRALLRRFPYSIYYVVEGDAVVVVGTFHCARRPATISATVQDRADGRLSPE
jgi:hypothetical protein